MPDPHVDRRASQAGARNRRRWPPIWRSGSPDRAAITRFTEPSPLGTILPGSPIIGVACSSNSAQPGHLSAVFSMPQRSRSSKYDPLIAFRRSSDPLALWPEIRRSCGLSRRPGSRYPGIVGRSVTRNRRLPASYGLWISLQIGDDILTRQPAIVQPFRENGPRGAGGELHALRLGPAGDVVHLSHRLSREQRVLELPPLANTSVIEPAKLYWHD
jgi:hypothetical protein